jgi:hypothetical protein
MVVFSMKLFAPSVGLPGLLLAWSLSPAAHAQVCYPSHSAYRLETQTIIEQQPVTTYKRVLEQRLQEDEVVRLKPVQETTVQRRQFTVQRPVVETSTVNETIVVRKPIYETFIEDRSYYETVMVNETSEREEVYFEYQPVNETTFQTQRYTVQRPVVETQMQTQQHLVQRPVYETQFQTQNVVSFQPVTSYHTAMVDQGFFVAQQSYQPGPTRHNLRWLPGGFANDQQSGTDFWRRGGLVWVPNQAPGQHVTQLQYQPNPVPVAVPQTQLVAQVTPHQVPVQTMRMESEWVQQQVPVQVTRMESQVIEQQVPVTQQRLEVVQRTRRVPVVTQKPVQRLVENKVPVQRVRYEEETVVRPVTVQRQSYKLETQVEEVPMTTTRYERVVERVQRPVTVERLVPVVEMQEVRRQVTWRVPVGSAPIPPVVRVEPRASSSWGDAGGWEPDSSNGTSPSDRSPSVELRQRVPVEPSEEVNAVRNGEEPPTLRPSDPAVKEQASGTNGQPSSAGRLDLGQEDADAQTPSERAAPSNGADPAVPAGDDSSQPKAPELEARLRVSLPPLARGR